MEISIYNNQKDFSISKKWIKIIAKYILEKEKIKFDEMAIHFVGKKTISNMHLKYFKDPSPTDCISFPIDKNFDIYPSFLGEIFICPKVAMEYAKNNEIDTKEEITLYLIHSILHLLGYDDKNKTKKIAMQKKEKSYMKLLKTEKLI